MSRVPAISVITPVWNGLPYIKEGIESVLAQEFQNWELLIGDNGSTDGTREYLAGLTDSRIRIYHHETNRGISGNLNFLFAKATAPLAYILCADDYFRPKGLTDVMAEWDSSKPSVAFIAFNPDPCACKIKEYGYNTLPKSIGPAESRLAFFLFGNFTGNLSNVSVKVSAVNSTGGFVDHLKTALDFEMWQTLAKTNDLILSKKDVVFVRMHQGSATHYMTQKGDDYGQLITIYEDLLEQLPNEYIRKRLVSYFNTQIVSQYFRTAIKYALSGRFAFMKNVLKVKSPLLWNTWSQLLICTPLALSPGLREYFGVKWAQNFMNQRKLKQGEFDS
ncbi:MAG TPA: glycosyltransferase family 2 protein [Chryseolinea sp.]|nr:glycosyltransferase family 2 protein [Chryseolinea sp.]